MTLTASQMGKKGGLKSAKKRFAGMSKQQRSAYMSRVRRGGKLK